MHTVGKMQTLGDSISKIKRRNVSNKIHKKALWKNWHLTHTSSYRQDFEKEKWKYKL